MTAPEKAQRRKKSRRGGGGGRRGGGARMQQLQQFMTMTSYLMLSPGMQQMMVWGGHEATTLAGKAVDMAQDVQELGGAATAWEHAAADLHDTADELRAHRKSLDGWQSAAAEEFRTAHGGRIDALAGTADRFERIADTLHETADNLSRAQLALLVSGSAAGESLRLMLTAGVAPNVATSAVLAGWLASSRELLNACDGWLADAAGTLHGLHP